MTLQNIRDLFHYDLTVLLGAEQQIRDLLTLLAGEVGDLDTQQLLRTAVQSADPQIQNLTGCFQLIGLTPEVTPCAVIDGLRQDHDTFVQTKPDPGLLTLYDLDLAEKIKAFEITAYRLLITKACLLGLSECQQLLQANQRADEGEGHESERAGYLLTQQLAQTAAKDLAA